MATTLQKTAKDSDLVCRYGGDEFIVISTQNTWEDSLKKMDSITEQIVAPLSASAGCVFDHVSRIDELNRLIEMADEKMYTYKKNKKRNR